MQRTFLQTDAEDFLAGIDEAQAEEILHQDAVIAEHAVLGLIKLGSGALQRSILRRKVNFEEHAEVPEQFMRWVWAGGYKLKGVGLAMDCGKGPLCVSIMLADISVGFFK